MATLPMGMPPGPQPPPQTFGGQDVGGQMAGNGPQTLQALQEKSQLEQSSGILEAMKDLSMGLQQAQEFLMTVASQYPGTAQYARTTIEALDVASKSMVDVLTAVVSQSQMAPSQPNYIG